MKLSPETKHALIIGGGLIVAVVVAIVVYKKYQVSSQAGQAASDQATQDELAYIEEQSLEGGAEFGSVDTSGSSVTLPSAPASQSLAQEIQSIEGAFGLGTSSGTSTGTSTGTSASTSSGSSSSGSSPAPKTPSAPIAPYQPRVQMLSDEPVAEYTV